MKIVGKAARWAGIGMLVVFGAGAAMGQPVPFGNKEDVDYAAALWEAMESANMAGPDAIRTIPYQGTEPHGFVLETFFTKANIDGYLGDLVIKRNYGPAGIGVDQVQADYEKYLDSVTIMFKREAGYDSENKDWFYAKYLPDGSLDSNANGIFLAGRVAKGASRGCMACHSLAPGGDFLYVSDAIK